MTCLAPSASRTASSSASSSSRLPATCRATTRKQPAVRVVVVRRRRLGALCAGGGDRWWQAPAGAGDVVWAPLREQAGRLVGRQEGGQRHAPVAPGSGG
jgi:hypothetical protein